MTVDIALVVYSNVEAKRIGMVDREVFKPSMNVHSLYHYAEW